MTLSLDKVKDVPENTALTEIAEAVMLQTGNPHKQFYKTIALFHLAVGASNQRVSIKTNDRGTIPINMYTIALGSSGIGKNFSNSIVADKILGKFTRNLVTQQLPQRVAESIQTHSIELSKRQNSTSEEISDALHLDYINAGEFLHSFDSATTSAFKQLRGKLLIANYGALTLTIDEIGSNIREASEILKIMLTAYDTGDIDEKLIKNTKEQTRSIPLLGNVPANLLLMGTPHKLFNGSHEEHMMSDLLSTGFARRCTYGFADAEGYRAPLDTAAQEYEAKASTAVFKTIAQMSTYYAGLLVQHPKPYEIVCPRDVSIELIEYERLCKQRASEYTKVADIKKSEMTHRYFKALKIAGLFAHIESSPTITITHLHQAIKEVEESGEVFHKHFLSRPRPYERLAKYLAEVTHEVTFDELVTDLPFFDAATITGRKEMLNYAIAYGFKHNISISQREMHGILFLKGSQLQKTSLKSIYVASSKQNASGYSFKHVPWNRLSELFQADGYNWITHQVSGNHRSSENVIEGFNLVVLDVDKNVHIKTVLELLSEYTFYIYTTKRHTAEKNRFRIVMPISHTLKLDADRYKEFMTNIYKWLPFEVDSATGQRERKWLSCKGQGKYYDGDLLDATLFIPDTKDANALAATNNNFSSVSNLKRWFMRRIDEGNRNTTLFSYACVMFETGSSKDVVFAELSDANAQVKPPITKSEIKGIVLNAEKAVNKKKTSNPNT